MIISMEDRRNCQCQFTIKEEGKLVNLYLSGKTSSDIGKIMGCASYTIRRILSIYDVKMRNFKQAQNVRFNLFTIFFDKFTKQNDDCWL